MLVACGGMLQLCSPAYSQTAPAVPDDVQAIIRKVKGGGNLTPEERQRLQEWGESAQTQRSFSAKGANLAAGSGSKPASTTGQAESCPPAQAVTVAAAGPTRAEYIALVKSLAATYGPRAGKTRAKVDALLAKSPGPVTASEVGAILLGVGAAQASVYASASAAAANPDNPLLANNLGSALSTAGDRQSAVKVLLYAAGLAPKSSLVSTNLGWSYFQAGQSKLAQAAFQRASSLGPNMAGPLGGMGLLAACRGDNVNAQKYLQSSLDKRFSPTYAAALAKTKVVLGGGSGGAGSGASTAGESGGASAAASGSAGEPKQIPALPDVEDAPHGAAAFIALDHTVESAHRRTSALLQQMQQIVQRIKQLNIRAYQDPGGALVVPVLFDKELFQFEQTWLLSFNQAFAGQSARIEQYQATSQTVHTQFSSQLQEAVRQLTALSQQAESVEKEGTDKCQKLPDAGGARNACVKSYLQRMSQINAEHDKEAYELCLKEKQMLNSMLSAEYKVYKPAFDNFRRVVDDSYAFTDPIIQRIYVPAWNDLLQNYRETVVINVYGNLAGMAQDIARQGNDIQHMHCVEPVPLPAENAQDPSLSKTKADCPRNPPAKFDCTIIRFEWGCDTFKIEGGEGLMASVEWDFKKNETTIWAGAGVSATADAVPGVKAGFEGKVGAAFTFGGASGGLVDVALTSEVAAEMKVGGHGFEGRIATGMAAEGGPSVTASGQFEGSSFGGTLTNH